MKEDFKIAWRNLWRNKRRTVITSASVFFAVFFAVIMRSVQLGSYDRMIMNFIESYSGYLQVQNTKFQDNPSIDYSFKYSDSLCSQISEVKDVISVAPHIESFVLASSGTQTKGVAVLGIDPGKEKKFSNPQNKLVRYSVTEGSINTFGLDSDPKIAESIGALTSLVSKTATAITDLSILKSVPPGAASPTIIELYDIIMTNGLTSVKKIEIK